ncbi:MAG: FkbM family methyltransferase [Crocosphaera sp.]|nr:FkbM family methyltransferase [Crocosphaera sp.]
MNVETCCQALLEQILLEIDKKKTGICIDVGVGTFAFYCEKFARCGFQTVAVEPLPNEKLRKICQTHDIHLIESCLSNTNDIQNLYMGKFAGLSNRNFSSLNPNWFGSSNNTKPVPSITLANLLDQLAVPEISCLKLDIEGWESVVIKQLTELPESLLPKVIMFEYGGGANRQSQQAGWSSQFLKATRDCLSILKNCGYDFSVIIDFAPDAKELIFDLQASDLNLEKIFQSNSIYGNIISCRNFHPKEADMSTICASYYDGWIDRLTKALVLNFSN